MPLTSVLVPARRSAARKLHPALVLMICFLALLALHAPLLRLSYFWDEAGYYVPAARDLLLTGSLIPHSTLSNAHPPLVIALLAAAWKLFGYSPLVAHVSMLAIAAFTLLAVFRLARQVANDSVALAAVICTALYPVFFAQSALAHIDMAAAGLILWGVADYLRGRRAAALIFFALACLAKETAILVPLALFTWEMTLRIKNNLKECHPERGGAAPPSRGTPTRSTYFRKLAAVFYRETEIQSPDHPITRSPDHSIAQSCLLLLPLFPLAAWFAYHYLRTGYIFGNPVFFDYNLAGTLHPLRILIAFGLRLWQLLGYMNMFVLVIAAALALRLRPRLDPATARRKAGGNGDPELSRPSISAPVLEVFGVLILAHVVALSLVGGAVLARYLLPVYPLVIIICVSTLWRRVPWWPAFVAVVCAGFVTALVVNPPYRFAPEDNLAYADYVRLHQQAERFLEQRYPGRRVLTAWPASDELTRPWLGYVTHPLPVLRIEDFSAPQLFAAQQARAHYQLALLFSIKTESDLPFRFPAWERIQTRYFGYHRDLTAAGAAELLGARIIFQQHRHGQWVAILQLQTIENAVLR